LNESRNATRDLEKQLQDAHALADDLRRNRSALEDKLEQVEREREVALKPSDFENELENVKNELEVKRERVSNLESRLADAERFLDEKHQQLCKAISRADSFESLVNEKNDVIDDLSKQIWEKDGQIDKLQKEVEGLQAEQGQHHFLPEQMQQLKNRMEEDRKQVDVLRKENERLISDMNTLQETVSALQEQLSEKEDELHNLEKARNDAQWSLGEHIQWLADANNRADGLQNALEEKEREIKELREEISRITQVADEEKLMCQRALEEMNAKLAEFEKSPKQEDIDALDATIESLRNEISEKDKCIENITKSKNDAEQSLNEHSQWLLDANSRIADLENNEKDKDKRITALHDEIEQLSGKVVLDLKAALEAVQRNEKLEMPVEELVAKLNDAERALAESPKLNDFLSLKAENDDLRKKLHEKEACLEGLEKEKNDAQWRLGEHIQWLKDANDRANWLDGFVHDKDRSISELQQENEQLRCELASAPKSEDVGLINLEASSRDKDDIIDGLRRELEALRAEDAAQDDDRMRCLEHQVKDLNRAMQEKDEYVARLEKERNDKEWSLGEHRQWLSDANNRADELAAKLRKAEDELSRREHTEEPDGTEKCKVRAGYELD
uniref:Myosin_tail_1 domain-containing protein n=1 Tax=Gongylonema pulchrum TaxID=637853 RepID=A0A183DVA0_9BILA